MLDVTFPPGVVSPSNLIAQYSAQDLEALPDGVAPTFNFSEQFGYVSLGNDSISPSIPEIPNDGEEDFEVYPDGTIEIVDQFVNNGSVRLSTAYLYPST